MLDIFEQPWTLLIAAIIVLFVMLVLRRILPEKQHWFANGGLALPIFLIVAAFGLDWLVKTDLEKINTVINTGVKAVENEDCASIEAIISDNYHDSYHNTKKDLMYYCRARLAKPLVEKNIKRIVSIDISGPKATAIFTVRIIFDKQSYVYQSFKSQVVTKVEINLQKELDKWLIKEVEVLEIDRQPVNWQDIR